MALKQKSSFISKLDLVYSHCFLNSRAFRCQQRYWSFYRAERACANLRTETFVSQKPQAFINICHSQKVASATSTARADGSGADWAIPYTLSTARMDKDKGNVAVKVEICMKWDRMMYLLRSKLYEVVSFCGRQFLFGRYGELRSTDWIYIIHVDPIQREKSRV